jgi:hypothetical protein
MTKATIDSRVEPAEDGHGFAAIVTADGQVVFDSRVKHGQKAGTFDKEAPAATHASAWAKALRSIDGVVEDLRQRRRAALTDQVITLGADAAQDTDMADQLRKNVKVFEKNAEGRRARMETLAKQARDPRVRIEWVDHTKPADVRVVPESSDWDTEFEPEKAGDPRQLSIAGINWSVTRVDGSVSRVVGYGKAVLEVEGGAMHIVFGNDEHVIRVKLDGQIEYTQVAPPTPAEPPAKDAKPPKKLKAKRGSLADKVLRERLQHIKNEQTLLGIYVLERASKPRQRVLDLISDLAGELDVRLLHDLAALDDGRDSTTLKPDLAAAVLVTSPTSVERDVLEQFVPECCDPFVLDMVLANEQERPEKEQRSEVIEVVRTRLAELTPPAVGTQTKLAVVSP